MPPLSRSARYRAFITDRDRALERILSHAQKDVSRLLHEWLEASRDKIVHRYLLIPSDAMFTAHAKRVIHGIDLELSESQDPLVAKIADCIVRMKKHVSLLAYSGEHEAISQATGKPNKEGGARSDAFLDTTWSGERLSERVALAVSRLRRKIIDAIETARVKEDGPRELSERIMSAYPQAITRKRPAIELSRLVREAQTVVTGFIEDQDWLDMVNAYKRSELPSGRFDDEYAWEIEQEMNQEFLDQVRSSQHDAAKEAGIKDFVWIAVLDNRTDECCQWRDGLTTSEIESQLRSEHKGDECDAIVPPAHFNCRCSIAPIAEIPDRVESNLPDFMDWLNQ